MLLYLWWTVIRYAGGENMNQNHNEIFTNCVNSLKTVSFKYQFNQSIKYNGVINQIQCFAYTIVYAKQQ